MAKFDDLPLELVQEILRCNIPDGFESARLTSRHFYNASQQLVPQHRAFVQFFRSWSRRIPPTTPPPFDGGDLTTDHESDIVEESAGIAARELLMHIVRNPIVGTYVEHLDLREPVDYIERAEILVFNDADRKFVEEHVSRTEALQSISVDVWISKINYSDYLMVLLLTLVPRITSINPQQRWSNHSASEKELVDILRKLTTQANENSRGQELIALSRLRELRPSMDLGYDCKTAVCDAEPFLALSSVTACYAASLIALDDGYTGIPFYRNFKVLGWDLSTLELHQCVIGVSEIEALLQDMSNLTRLVVGLTTKWHGCGWEANAGGFVGAIARTPCVGTLQYMGLTVSPGWNDCFTGVDETLQKFIRLESLLIDGQWFQGPPYHLHEDFDEPNQTYGDGDRAQATPRLDKLLPRSIKCFELICVNPRSTPELLIQLFEGLSKELLRTALPKLDKVKLYIMEHQGSPIDRSIDPWPAITEGWTAANAEIEYFDDMSMTDLPGYERNEEEFIAKFGVFSM